MKYFKSSCYLLGLISLRIEAKLILMDILKYDVCRIYIASKDSFFYFIRNNKDDIYDSKGMDFSSLVYFLFFKLRSFRQDHAAYVRLLQKGAFDIRVKPYFNEDELMDLVNSCLEDENKLFKKWNEDIDLSLLNEIDELECMSYISKFNPRRNFYNAYCTSESGMKDVLRVLTREMNFDKIMENLFNNLSKNDGQRKIEELLVIDELKYLITGQNGDLWCDLFLKVNLPEFDKFRILYQAQPFKILENEINLKSVELIRCALDGVKNNHRKMTTLFEKLPKEMQQNRNVLNFYNWHREIIT